MNESRRGTMTIVLQSLQLGTLVIGVAGIFLTMGRKDARLEVNTEEIGELREIASDLVKASVESTATNHDQDRQLAELRNRIARLEPTR